VHAFAGAGVGVGRPAAVPEPPEDSDEAPDEEPEVEVPVATAPAGSRLADVAKSAALTAERTIIEDTLRQVNWNRRRAAEHLGVSYKTLLNKIKECGIIRK
jgi:DNA-binding NtrC family response regulator